MNAPVIFGLLFFSIAGFQQFFFDCQHQYLRYQISQITKSRAIALLFYKFIKLGNF